MGAMTTSICSTSSPCRTSTWARWRTRAQHLQFGLRPCRPGNGDRRGLRQYRPGGRPRIFPQLVRRPGHLSRLVPVESEGRLHGLPGPEFFGRHRKRAGQADRGRACAACSAIPGGRRSACSSRAAGQLYRDFEFLHGDCLQQGRRGHPDACDCAGN